MRRAGWLIVIAVVVGIAAPEARADDVEFGAFKTAFYKTVGGGIDSELGKVDSQLADPNTPPAARKDLRQARQELERLKKRVEDVKTVEALWGSVKSGRDAIKDLSSQFGKDYGTSLHIPTLAVDEMKQGPLSKWSSRLNTGVDYADKLHSLGQDIDAISTSELSPETKRLAKSMTVLTKIMSEFGSKVPLVGEFVKAYGDLGGELLKATSALDGKIKAREGGQMIDGVHGDRKFMLDQLRKQGFDSAQRLRALRDVFRTASGKLVIWDPAARDWKEVPGDVDEAELRRRYLHYAQRGIKNPTAKQVVGDFKKIVELDLTASKRRIQPGETIELRTAGTRVKDGKAITKGVYVRVTLASHTGVGSGEFLGAQEVQLGAAVRWKAPDNVNETYRFSMDLADASKPSASSTGPAKAFVYTGVETRIALAAAPGEVGFGGDVKLVARVTDGSGNPLDAKASGRIDIDVSPSKGYMGNTNSLTDGKGVEQTWTAPDVAGTYTFTATYEGATSYALFGSNTAGAEATATVKVRAPAYRFTVSPQSASVKKGETARFAVTLVNEDEEDRTFSVSGTVGPASQVPRWTVRKQSKSRVTLAGGASEEMTFELTPKDDPDAKNLRISLTAAPKGATDGKNVTFGASKGAGDKLLVQVKTAASKGQTRAGGKASLSGQFAPGDTIALSFKTWGERRKFCVEDVVEKNRKMKTVAVHSHGEDGCSYGTKDGRLRSTWSVKEKVTWSGKGVTARTPTTTATFEVPDEPGSYEVRAKGDATWTLTRKAASGRPPPTTKKESGTGSFTIDVSEP